MKRPWMPFYVPDYLGDTGHLSTLEHGAYMLLIMHYWMNGGLPEKEAQLARIVRLDLAEWREVAPTLQAFFHDGWKHKRVDEELAESAARYERRANAGKKGGQAKAGSGPNPSNATALPEQDASNAVATRGTRQPQPQPHCSDEQRCAASARTRDDLDQIEVSCREAAGIEHDRNSSRGLRNLQPILAWLDAGFSLDEDILPVIRRKAPPNLGSWAYFTKALQEALDASHKAVSAAQAAARNPSKSRRFSDPITNALMEMHEGGGLEELEREWNDGAVPYAQQGHEREAGEDAYAYDAEAMAFVPSQGTP